MRQQLLDYLKTNLTGTIKVSEEQPYNEKGVDLFIKNPRRVYLEEPFVESSVILNTLDQTNVVSERITHVLGHLAVDAKNRNTDLDAALIILANAKNAITSNSFRKEFGYTVSINNDIIVYTLEYRFYSLTT
jgi:hypothetical protein|tara:strand:- start:267 stop:662 length:396 start_codon:yes stop_codon:yes gene_type:complete